MVMVSVAVIGCSSVITGTATVDTEAAPVVSSARDAQLHGPTALGAVQTACETMNTTGSEALSALNVHTAAIDAGSDGADTGAKAAASLNRTASLVRADLDDTVPPQIHQALTDWVDAARATALTLQGWAGSDHYTATIDRLNASKKEAQNLCKGYY
jgi:hypothetical protein